MANIMGFIARYVLKSHGRRCFNAFLASSIITLSIDSAVSLAQQLKPSQERETEVEEHIKAGLFYHYQGEFEKAAEQFQKSVDLAPTVKGRTFLGWSFSYMGRIDKAIFECYNAIGLDPDFGNPYNDIGVLFIEMGKADKAVPYLKRAILSGNYCCYQFPHFNLGRIYMAKGAYNLAAKEFERALEIDPYYLPARLAIEILSKIIKKT